VAYHVSQDFVLGLPHFGRHSFQTQNSICSTFASFSPFYNFLSLFIKESGKKNLHGLYVGEESENRSLWIWDTFSQPTCLEPGSQIWMGLFPDLLYIKGWSIFSFALWWYIKILMACICSPTPKYPSTNYSLIIMSHKHEIFWKILFSHLFWLDSHLFCRSNFKQNKFECMRSSHALRGSQNHGVTKSDRQKWCESSQKRCENRIFQYFK